MQLLGMEIYGLLLDKEIILLLGPKMAKIGMELAIPYLIDLVMELLGMEIYGLLLVEIKIQLLGRKMVKIGMELGIIYFKDIKDSV